MHHFVGARIRAQRCKLALTQRELAAKVGVAPLEISRWERGVNRPRAHSLKPLAQALGVGIDWLFEGGPAGGSDDKAVPESAA